MPGSFPRLLLTARSLVRFRCTVWLALAHPLIADKLGLSEDQRNQIQTCLQDQRTLVRALVEVAADGQGNDPEDTMTSLRRTTDTRILMALNDAQRAKWQAVTGETVPAS